MTDICAIGSHGKEDVPAVAIVEYTSNQLSGGTERKAVCQECLKLAEEGRIDASVAILSIKMLVNA